MSKIREANAAFGVCPTHDLMNGEWWHSEDGFLHPEHETCANCGKTINFNEELIGEVTQGENGEAVYTHLSC